ncbi:MAG: sensor histidine kinase, partial [Chloroflexota bacterium]
VDLVLRLGQVSHYETPVLRRDGTLLWGRRSIRAVYNEAGEMLYFEGSIEDITGIHQAEERVRQLNAELEQRVQQRTAELQAANRELEAFAYSVSHDLRAPLRAIDGYARLLAIDYQEAFDGQGRQYLENVRQAAQRMSQLIDDLLKLSRVTRAEMVYTNVDLSALAGEVLQRLSAAQPGRQVELALPGPLPVQGDASLLRILLENLLGNAWKFTARTAQPRIELGAQPQDGQMVYYVCDNGAGFDMQYAPKLFGAFQRLHHMDEFEGTGIGLATVQRIVLRHGGRAWGQGAIGQGAKFFFTLSAPPRPPGPPEENPNIVQTTA